MYFEYFKDNYDGRFGVTSIKAMGVDTDETWYYITQKSELSDYFSDNPSARYTLYYVTDNTLDEDGNIVETPYICLTSDTNLTPPRTDTF